MQGALGFGISLGLCLGVAFLCACVRRLRACLHPNQRRGVPTKETTMGCSASVISSPAGRARTKPPSAHAAARAAARATAAISSEAPPPKASRAKRKGGSDPRVKFLFFEDEPEGAELQQFNV